MSAKPEQHLKVGDWWYLPQQDKLVKIDDAGEISETASLDNLCQKALNYFLVNAGRLVTRDELLSDVWGVRDVSDGRISRVIRVLRVALGDDSREPRYIETIPKRGFRFIAPVAEVILSSGNDEPASNHIEEQHAIQQQERKHHRHWWLLAGTFLCCVLAISGWQYWQQSQLDPQVPFGRFEPLSSMDGLELYPDVSKDGRYLVFTHLKDAAQNSELVVQDLVSLEKKVIKSVDSGNLNGAVWSPDGRSIIYQHLRRKISCELRHLTFADDSFAVKSDVSLRPCGINSMGARMAWSPDGKYLVYPDWREDSDKIVLMLYPLDGGKAEQLTTPPQSSLGDFAVRYSPDGTKLVFLRDIAGSAGQIWIFNIADRSTKLLHQPKNSYPGNVAWTSDSNEILFPSDTNTLSAYNLKTEAVRVFAYTDATALEVLTVPGGRVYASVGKYWQTSIRKVNNVLENEMSSTEILDYATRTEGLVELNPQDNGPVAVLSNRSGSQQVWLYYPDGKQQQISQFRGDFNPKVLEFSPDGKKLLVQVKTGIWLLQADKEPMLLTEDDQQCREPSWGADSNTVYYLLSKQGRWILMQRRLGESSPTEYSVDIDFFLESPDGSYQVRSLNGNNKFEMVKLATGEIVPLTFLPDQDFLGPRLVLRSKAIYFLNPDEEKNYEIHRYSLLTGQINKTGIEQQVPSRRYSVSLNEMYIFQDDGKKGDVDVAEFKLLDSTL